ncbi:hypothetical protein ACE14D_08910 [Streptomyces sp. Act-28]
MHARLLLSYGGNEACLVKQEETEGSKSCLGRSASPLTVAGSRPC